MKTGVVILFLVAITVVAAQVPIPNQQLRGEWSGPLDFPTLLTLTDRGVDSICRSELPPECEGQLPPGEETVVITENTIAFTFTTLVGVRTQEQSAELFPACAAAGIYPLETITPLPPAQIEVYESAIGSLTFTDPRRPNDPNCVFITRQEGGQSPSINLRYVLSSFGRTLNEVVEVGPSLRCALNQGLCTSEVDESGVLTAFAFVEFTIPCVAGDCMNSAF